MTRARWLTATAAILLVASSAGVAPRSSAAIPDPVILGHRGDSSRAPENTLAAIRKAAKAGADIIDIDTNLTHDNVPVLMHDRTLDRTTNGTGRTEGRSWRYVSGLDAGRWFDPEFRGEPVPTLYQAIDKAQALGLDMHIELKGTTTAAEAKQIARRWRTLDAFDDAIATSFTIANLDRIRAESHRIRTSLNTGAGVTVTPAEAAAQGEVISIHKGVATPAYVAALHGAGVRVYAWVADTPAEWAILKAAGIDGIITNVPADLAAWLAVN